MNKKTSKLRFLWIIFLLILCFIFASGAVWLLAGGCASTQQDLTTTTASTSSTIASSSTAMGTTTTTIPGYAFVANEDSSNMTIYSIDPLSGSLLRTMATESAGYAASSIAITSSGDYLYLGNYNSIRVYRFIPGLGTATFIGSVETEGPVQRLIISPSGKFLYAAIIGKVLIWTDMIRSFQYPGYVKVFSIDQSNGSLTLVETEYTGPPLSPHDVKTMAIDPSGEFAYVTDQLFEPGSAEVIAYSIDQATGMLISLETVPVGDNPVWIAIDPSGKFAYILNRNDKTISCFNINSTTGNLSLFETRDTVLGPLSMAIDAGGKYAYLLQSDIFSGAGKITIYSINSVSGALSEIDNEDIPKKWGLAYRFPSSIALDPSGKFLYEVNNIDPSSDIIEYSVDQSTGLITKIGEVAADSGPVFITTWRK